MTKKYSEEEIESLIRGRGKWLAHDQWGWIPTPDIEAANAEFIGAAYYIMQQLNESVEDFKSAIAQILLLDSNLHPSTIKRLRRLIDGDISEWEFENK